MELFVFLFDLLWRGNAVICLRLFFIGLIMENFDNCILNLAETCVLSFADKLLQTKFVHVRPKNHSRRHVSFLFWRPCHLGFGMKLIITLLTLFIRAVQTRHLDDFFWILCWGVAISSNTFVEANTLHFFLAFKQLHLLFRKKVMLVRLLNCTH